MLFAVPEKKAILNLRLDPDVREQFAIAAKLRGASMSGLLHQFIIRTIKEEKAEAPQAFGKLAPVVARIGPDTAKAEIQKDLDKGLPYGTINLGKKGKRKTG
ncbi:MAG: hypothetical protein JO053_03950 [Acidobacteria bacterium]|nr:hypothetical protein [Acidobacteriota bacterium]